MGGGLESRCVGRVYGADGAVHGTIRTITVSGYVMFVNIATFLPAASGL